jgi:hypothetical protein
MQGRLIRSCGTIFVDAPQVLNVRCSKAPLPEDLRAFFVSPHPRSKKEAERRKAQISTPQLSLRLASSGTRSPSGVPPRLSPMGQLLPKAQRQAMLPGTWPGRLSCPPQRGAEDQALLHGRYPAQPVPVQRSTSHTGHSAGRMMPDPPENRVYSPVRRHRTRSALPNTFRKASFVNEIKIRRKGGSWGMQPR